MNVMKLGKLGLLNNRAGLGSFDNASWDSMGSDNFSTPQDAPDYGGGGSSGGGGLLDGLNVMNVLKLVGGTWAQIEQAKHGKQVIVGGKDIAPQLRNNLEQQAKANNTSSDMLMMMIMNQMAQNNKQKQPKDNTTLYIGLGVGALVLLGAIVMMTKNKN
ncbi:hypothetical protein [Tenacibaculum dicentrarchi]|uniref:hypothetical protein n=1 Tax=Tenacibaculum dicentrarchi TaxID=669041 RepID=UPI000CC93F3B|nr:hypothetical protein [Tenacibaculum dicentrarchi]SOU87846.1 conserved hypothetical protein [Tenacibaculum dicentrarchi]